MPPLKLDQALTEAGSLVIQNCLLMAADMLQHEGTSHLPLLHLSAQVKFNREEKQMPQDIFLQMFETVKFYLVSVASRQCIPDSNRSSTPSVESWAQCLSFGAEGVSTLPVSEPITSYMRCHSCGHLLLSSDSQILPTSLRYEQ